VNLGTPPVRVADDLLPAADPRGRHHPL